MRLALFVVSILFVCIFGVLVFKPAYKSAFEADQQCHFEMSNLSVEKKSLGCDHDLETSQWILYQISPDHQPALVLERFRY